MSPNVHTVGTKLSEAVRPVTRLVLAFGLAVCLSRAETAPPDEFASADPPSERVAQGVRCAAMGAASLPGLLELWEGRPDMRADIAWVLGLMGSVARPACPTLCGALTDPSPAIRASAALAVGAMGDEAAAVHVVEALLAETDPDAGEAEALAFANLGLPAQECLFVDPASLSTTARYNIALALGRSPALLPHAWDVLVALGHDGLHRVRLVACWALGQSRPLPGNAVDLLLELAGDEDAEIRAQALKSLASGGAPLDVVRRTLLPLLASPDSQALAAARTGLFARPEPMPELWIHVADALGQEPDAGKAVFLRALLVGHAPPADRLLDYALHGPAAIRVAALEGVVHLRPLSQALCLCPVSPQLVTDPHDEVRAAAITLVPLLAAVSPPEGGAWRPPPEVEDAISAEVASPIREVRLAAVMAEVKMRWPKERDEWFDEFVAGLEPDAWETAMRGLLWVDPGNATRLLARAREEKDPQMRAALISAVGAPVRGQDSMPDLIPFLDDPAPEVRSAVLSSLGLSAIVGRNKDQIAKVAALLFDPDPGVRALAAGALGRWGPSALSALPVLEWSAASDGSHTVRFRASFAVDGIRHGWGWPAALGGP